MSSSIVTQVPAPLRLRRRNTGDPDVPPSYPMQAVDMGVDLYEPAPDSSETSTGLIRKSPYQYGHWVMHPMYSGAISFMVDTKLMKFYTRSHLPVSPEWQPERVLRDLRRYTFHDELRWLQALRVSRIGDGPHGNLLKFALVIQDFVHPTWNHSARRSILKDVLPQIGVRTRPEDGKVYLIPEFPESAHNMPQDLWSALHVVNDDWKRAFYGGITMKQANARFYSQMDDFNKQTLFWHDHKFDAPLSNANEA